MRSFGLNWRVLALAVGTQLFAAGAAHAHSLIVTATSTCSDSGPVINFTVTASLQGIDGQNDNIDVSVNGVHVFTGVFDPATGDTFSGVVPAPSGTTAIVSATAIGTWGDTSPGGQSTSTTVEIATGCTTTTPGIGRFTGGGFQLRVGEARVTRGLTIHCDLLLSNNLEINWGGNQFHMEEHLQTLSCVDDPTIVQAPPTAPIDTLVGVGIGRYNGVDGYTIQFVLVDAGEPGTSDRMGIRIFETANPSNVVLDIPVRTLDGGNLQAHYDQPHK